MNLKYIELEDMEVAEQIFELESIVKKGGPEKNEYSKLRDIAINLKNISLTEELQLYDIFKPVLNINSVIGHTFLKPHGYAGDYELIDKIYLKEVSNDPFLEKWDHYYHDADSSTAVRNRKNYFINQIKKVVNQINDPRILNLGSGPCRDVNEYYMNNKSDRVYIDCLDMDPTAIEYGSGVCDNYISNIRFINKNAFLFKPEHKYNLIWSAGLFDYFSDKLFVRLANRMYKILEENGELIIGNFSTSNPGREEMEVFGQWYLHHRNEEKLIDLAMKAGVEENNISVNKERTGVNLFLHLKK